MSRISCILYPPTHDYYYMVQRPHQLMKSFSELEIPCYFMNNPFLTRPKRGIQQVNPNLFLFNDVDTKPFLRDIRPVVYFVLPDHINAIKQYRPSLVVFDTIDEPSEEFSHLSRNYYRALKESDIVLATSDKLFNIASAINPFTYLVPNGCDYEYFSQANTKHLPIPQDLEDIPRPIIGYLGAVASWCDLQLVDNLALRFPHCSIVMVGPLYNINQVPLRSNLHWLGLKDYEQVAAYVQAFDVGIIPFRQSGMIESVNPIKMWEYMAAGIPVVTTDLPEARKYQDVVLCSNNEEQFMENIHQALYNDSPDKRAERMDLAWHNSWSIRARQIVHIIDQRLALRGVVPPEHNALPELYQEPAQSTITVMPGQMVKFRQRDNYDLREETLENELKTRYLPRKTTISTGGFTHSVNHNR